MKIEMAMASGFESSKAVELLNGCDEILEVGDWLIGVSDNGRLVVKKGDEVLALGG